MKKFIIVLVVILIAGVGFFYLKPSVEIFDKNPPMKVARIFWPGQFWVDIADKKGWFKEEGLDVELVDTSADYYKSIEDLASGKLDTQNLYLFDLIVLHIKGTDLVMVMNNDVSTGAEALIVNKEITSVEDLKKKKIAVPRNSNIEYLLNLYLEKNGLETDDILKINLSPEEMPLAFSKNEVDGFISYEPHLSQGIEFGGVKLFDSTEFPGVSTAGYSFRRDFIKERPEDVQKFVNVWNKTTEFIKDNPEETYKIIAEIYGVTIEEVEAIVDTDQILDLKDNLERFAEGSDFSSLYFGSREFNKFLFKNSLTDIEDVDLKQFLNPTFIKELKNTND